MNMERRRLLQHKKRFDSHQLRAPRQALLQGTVPRGRSDPVGLRHPLRSTASAASFASSISCNRRRYSSGESKTHSGALFFMTSLAPLCRTSSKIFPASPLLNREIGTVFSMAPRMEFITYIPMAIIRCTDRKIDKFISKSIGKEMILSEAETGPWTTSTPCYPHGTERLRRSGRCCPHSTCH